MPPTATNLTESFIEAELAEEEHAFDARSALALNLVIIGCLLLAYFVKKFRIYYLPESGGALMVGMVIGGIVRLATDKLALFEFVSQKPQLQTAWRFCCLTDDIQPLLQQHIYKSSPPRAFSLYL